MLPAAVFSFTVRNTTMPTNPDHALNRLNFTFVIGDDDVRRRAAAFNADSRREYKLGSLGEPRSRLSQLIANRQNAYAVEARLIGFDGIPPLHESLEDLRGCGECFLGLDDETGLAGAVSWVLLQNGTLQICWLMAHPRAFRRGIATALLGGLDRTEPVRRALVSTGTARADSVRPGQTRVL
jgi:hypothetical protein